MKTAIFVILATSASAFSFGIRPQPKIKLDVAQIAKVGAVTAAICIGVASPAFAGDVGAGEQIFNANCAACHAGGQNVIMPERTLEKDSLSQFLAGGVSEKSIASQVTNGKNAMPAFGGRLSDDDINDVAAYVIATSESGWE